MDHPVMHCDLQAAPGPDGFAQVMYHFDPGPCSQLESKWLIVPPGPKKSTFASHQYVG